MSASQELREDSEPQRSPITEPPKIGVGRGHPEYHFVQSVMELTNALHKMDADQKVSMTKLEGKVDALKESIDGTKKKVDDLVRWKTMILGGAVALGVVVSALFALYVKFGDRISITPEPTRFESSARPQAK